MLHKNPSDGLMSRILSLGNWAALYFELECLVSGAMGVMASVPVK